jgi:hypothetical protein
MDVVSTSSQPRTTTTSLVESVVSLHSVGVLCLGKGGDEVGRSKWNNWKLHTSYGIQFSETVLDLICYCDCRVVIADGASNPELAKDPKPLLYFQNLVWLTPIVVKRYTKHPD